MSVANTVEHKPKYSGEYTGVVVSRNDELMQGRLLVKVPELLGDEPIWAQAKFMSGALTIQAIPPEGQEVKVVFNGDAHDCTWSGGRPTSKSVEDVDLVYIADDKDNGIYWHRLTGEFKINAKGTVDIVSKSKIKLSAPTIELDGSVSCKHGASGIITMLNSAVFAGGIATDIS